MKSLFLILLVVFSFSAHAEEFECHRPMYNQPEWFFKNCAKKLSSGEWKYKKELLGKLNFGKNNLAPVCIEKNVGCFWVNRQGKMVQSLESELSADDFSEGLARHVKNGKIGFMNESLEVVIPPKYDHAGAFEKDQTAIVCIGCKEEKPQKEENHWTRIVGGQWYVIDKKGKVLKECGSSIDDCEPKPKEIKANCGDLLEKETVQKDIQRELKETFPNSTEVFISSAGIYLNSDGTVYYPVSVKTKENRMYSVLYNYSPTEGCKQIRYQYIQLDPKL